MLWHRDRGFDGSKPPDDVSLAIHAAVTFAVLDANDRLRLTEPDDGNKARDLATTENADLFIQPITEDDGRITHRRGGLLKSISVGNMKIGAEPPPLADAVERIDSPVPASSALARAVYEMVRTDSQRGRAVATAAEWHRVALANPEAVTMGQRLTALKTGFEALFRTSSSRVAAQRLRNLFEDRTRQHLDHFPWKGLLWAPTEKRFLWRWRWQWFDHGEERRIEPIGEIEDWFMALAAARNGVIHSGRLPTSKYDGPPERPLSRYVGSLFWVGERVLREAIKAKIGAEVLLCGAIARRAWAEAKLGKEAREFAKKVRAAKGAGTLPPPPPEAHPPRALSKILRYLQVDSANLVTVGPLGLAGNGYSHEASAHRERITMSITGSEYLALRAAGAEEEVSDSWDPCP